MLKVAVLTVSDSASMGEKEDLSGQAIRKIVVDLPGEVVVSGVVADDVELIREKILYYTDTLEVDLLVTTGGTGVSPRDVTPEATEPLIEKLLPGLPEAMRAEGLKKTNRAMITRGLAGIRKRTLIINLPGSPKGATENLETVFPALSHIIEKCQGDPSPCART